METILNYSNNNNYNNNNSNNNNHHHSPINNIIQTEHLEFNYLQDLCNRGQLAFSHANYHNAIAIYDRVIDQIQGKIIGKMFFFRCITNYQLGDYQQALKDAQRAILADPTLADAYLVGGNILFVVQQLWADAVTLYQYGMDHVPINDPKYQHLVQCKNQVTQEIRQRNTRMLHILPYDIICEIMAKLSIADRLNCAACCKDWHDYLLDSPVMWQDIHLDDPPSLLDKIGVIASQHVRRLTLTGSRRNQDVLNRLVEFNWCHLESITISNSRINRSSWRRLLHINNNIKSIKLADTQAGAEDTSETEGLIHDIFEFCSQHLTNLTYIQHIEDRRWYYNFYDRPFPTFKLPESSSPLALTTLNIACHLTLTYLPQLLPHCSNLKHLAIDADKHEGEDTDLLELVERSCPQLLVFHYGNGLMEEDQHTSICNNTTTSTANFSSSPLLHHRHRPHPHEPNRLRLKQLAYFPNITHQVDHQLARLVETSSQTLEMFRLSMLMRPATQTLNRLATWGAPQLERLELLDAPYKNVGKIIHACPSIRWITLDSATDETLDSLMTLEHLQRLNLSLNMEAITVDKLKGFFTSARTLHNVNLTAADHFTDAHLLAIHGHHQDTFDCNNAKKRTIETLELGGCITTSITVEGIQRFAQQHADTLLQLTLTSTSVPMHDKVVALAGLKSLRSLTLRGHGCMDVSKDTVAALFTERQRQHRQENDEKEMSPLSVILYRTRDAKPVVYTSDMSQEMMDQVERKIQPDILSKYSNMAWLGMLREA